MQDKYMAYVGSYSYNGQAKGITVYDVDVENGKFIYRCEVEVDNSSYLTVSHDGRMLYSIADEGVVAFRILENGALSRVNSANIKAMRGCHIATDTKINLSSASVAIWQPRIALMFALFTRLSAPFSRIRNATTPSSAIE